MIHLFIREYFCNQDAQLTMKLYACSLSRIHFLNDYLKQLNMIDSAENNNQVYCNTSSTETFRLTFMLICFVLCVLTSTQICF